jgi:N-acyl homoserine lactone hydrolase
MRKGMTVAALAAMMMAGLTATAPASAQTQAAAPPAKVTLTRLDCGTFKQPRDVGGFSDAFAYSNPPLKLPFIASCYLIRHGERYMLWDAGYAAANDQIALPRTIVQQLAELGVDPAKVEFVGISHYHGDHTGQAGSFPNATLLIGQGDWDVLTATPPPFAGVDPKPLANWVSGGGKVEKVAVDKDVFGDGSVLILNLPGHTPGHHGLLVRLPKTGPVLLSGDVVHFQENYDHAGVPQFNTNRADSLASIDRFKDIATALKATVIIQHDPRSLPKLPAFPKAAE